MRSKLKLTIENAVKLRVVNIGRNPLTRRPWVEVEIEAAFSGEPVVRRLGVDDVWLITTTIENSVGSLA